MGRPSFRRRKFFIKKEFQGKFIALYSLGVIALSGVTTLVLNSWLHEVVDRELYSSHMKVQRTGELFQGPLIQTNLYAILAIGLLILTFSLVVFKRLNRHFSGMDQAFHAMANGDFQSYDPRGSRFEEISEMIDMVRQAQDLYNERTKELVSLTREIEAAIAAGCPEDRVKSLHERLATAVGRVQLPETA